VIEDMGNPKKTGTPELEKFKRGLGR